MKIVTIPAALLLLGLALAVLNAGAPRMLKADWQLAVKEGDSDSYFREFDRNLSPQARRFDFGAGLASLSVSLIVLIAVTRSWSVQRVKVLQTPRSRWLVFLLSNLTWLYYVWGVTQFLVLQARRDEFPPWADSIAIPMVGIWALAPAGLVVINVALMVYLHKATLPAPMWMRPRTLRAWVLNVGVALALLACLWAGCDAVRLGDVFTLPAFVAITYLLFVGRAAASTN